MSKQVKKIEIVAYTDFVNRKARAGRDILDRVVDKLGDDVSFQYKICPPLHGNKDAFLAAKAALAADNQGQFEIMHHRLMEHDAHYTEQIVFEIAQHMNLDMKRFEKDFHSDELEEILEQNWIEAEKADVHIIPSLTINNKTYHGAWDEHVLLEAVKDSGGHHVQILIENFFKRGAAAAFALLIATLSALLFTNTGFHETYEHWWHANLGFVLGHEMFQLPL